MNARGVNLNPTHALWLSFEVCRVYLDHLRSKDIAVFMPSERH